MLGRRALFTLFATLASCGTLPLTGPDGGADGSMDVSPAEVGVDSSPAIDAGAEAAEASGDAAAEVSSDAAVPSLPWGKSLGGGLLLGVAVDSSQDVILGGKLTPQNGYDNFLVEKLDSSGAVLWKNAFGTSGSYQPHLAYSVAVDAAGDVYATGYTNDALDVGGGPKGPGAFIVKYDASGAFQWQYGPFAQVSFQPIRVKSNGNVVIAGDLHGSLDFGGGTLTSAGNGDALIVELTASGSYVQAKSWGDPGNQRFVSLALDASDDIYLTGALEGTVDFGGGAMTGGSQGSGSFDVFVLELDPKENYLHQNDTHTSSNGVALSGVAVDAAGDVYVAGASATGTGMTLGGSALDCGGAIAAGLDSSLAHVWSNCHAGGSGNAVTADPSGGAVLAGGYLTTIDFGQGPLLSYRGAFLAAFDASGKSLASYGTGSSQNYLATAYSVGYLAGPDFVMVGQCSDAITLPSGPITCSPNGDALVARLPP